MRLRTLPLALASIGMGSFLAAAAGGFSWVIFLLCLLTTVSLQILSNLANDYGDTVHGADSQDRIGPSRAVQQGLITQSSMRKAIGLATLVSLALGLLLLWRAGVSREVFLIFAGLGLLAILAAILYTNGFRPYGYLGLGDLSVFLFFGWLGVLGTYYLQTGDMDWQLLLPGAACGLFTVAVLNVNNIRDMESDQQAGKYSIPVRLGKTKAIGYHLCLLILGLACAALFVLLNYETPYQWLFMAVVPLLWYNANGIIKKPSGELDPYLKQMALSTLFFVFTFGVGILL